MELSLFPPHFISACNHELESFQGDKMASDILPHAEQTMVQSCLETVTPVTRNNWFNSLLAWNQQTNHWDPWRRVHWQRLKVRILMELNHKAPTEMISRLINVFKRVITAAMQNRASLLAILRTLQWAPQATFTSFNTSALHCDSFFFSYTLILSLQLNIIGDKCLLVARS